MCAGDPAKVGWRIGDKQGSRGAGNGVPDS